ncbi:CFAP221 [Bugula neritina]|uniref:CFAP221 n=1 Tax=Bugula neritina TaxID=10212 RepID=A0A7J7JDT2_BUGNE|nr:CFAP221 [Bugula neritina]
MALQEAAPFIETFQFVEPKSTSKSKSISKAVVPNHLLSSKIYTKVQQNAAIKATPAIVHFEGMEIGKTVQQVISLCNVAREVVRLHIIPPQTRHFNIKYTKSERLVPGMTMNCIVEFTPEDYRYYYDSIRIHTPGEDNIIIPIHAYPLMDSSEVSFPTQVPKHSDWREAISLIFSALSNTYDEAFTVTPLSGVVPANGSTTVYIHYQPISYCTSIMKLQLDISQFNCKPMVCTVTGYCQPGLNAVKPAAIVQTPLHKSRVSSPLERSRQKKLLSRKSTKALPEEQNLKQKRIIDGIRIPDKIETVHHVSNILLQKPGKMTLKELIEAEKSVSGRQMKENRFEQAVRKNVYEERQNQLRWQVKIGDTAMKPQDKAKIVSERQHSWAIYRELRGDPTPSEERRRTETESLWRRTLRDASQLAEEGIQFDLYTNNPWSTRHSATDKFTQAARKIIMRNRAKKNLKQLNAFLKNWNKKQEMLEGGQGETSCDPEEEDVSDTSTIKLRPILASTKVVHAKYPFFVPPNKKDELAPDALNEVVTYETDIDLGVKTPFFDLQVPAQSRLMGYNDHEIHLGYDYVEPVLARSLRTGAQDEIVNLVKPHEAVASRSEVLSKSVNAENKKETSKRLTSLRVEDLEEHEAEKSDMKKGGVTTALTPPEAMFKPIEYPPLHIFNATPGLQVFKSPVAYAEVDSDYHLCPLPKYTLQPVEPSQHKSTQKEFLDREDVIKGTMTWKKFPSQGLTSLSNVPTLSNVWVPRWNDPFSDDLLPLEVPSLQSGLAEEDVLEHMDEEGDDMTNIVLTPEMVAVQFDTLSTIPSHQSNSDEKQLQSDHFPNGNKMPTTYLPVSSSGPVPREQREQELDQFISRRSNRLGQRIHSKLTLLNNQTTRDDLVLQ